ncbi:alpha/beta-hydrolase [Aulographum hederae CBS 113979]|uniref:Carboxylic ester hydrolase n=1 Tax=Aulographum hederae CBS 113979 TaxID=1176131 RepID=A0A6G1H0M7_9PEZI|nr:alpha/beta-hydrolase [Aulographum hederae CBS 113979]
MLASNTSHRLLAALSPSDHIQSEDCLHLNIWTKPQTGEKAKAVLVWIHGGGFQGGSPNNPASIGQYLAYYEDVVVVSAAYRLNIFGFPGLPGAGIPQNAGLLDQRLAVEWVRDNIASFGGDPSRITLFGQSAGAAGIDYYSYAWKNDPIVAGFIPQSGTVTSFNYPPAAKNTASWWTTSATLGCGNSNSTTTTALAASIVCLRKISFRALLNATIITDPTAATLGNFAPTADNLTVFPEYFSLRSTGQFIRKPYFTGSNAFEAGLFRVLYAPITFTDRQYDLYNLGIFTCPAGDAAAARTAHGVPAWHYRYFGEFPNLRLTLNPSSGAWHGAEIQMVFGTSEDASGEVDTAPESVIGRVMRRAWADFAKRPGSTFDEAPYRWPRYTGSGKKSAFPLSMLSC